MANSTNLTVFMQKYSGLLTVLFVASTYILIWKKKKMQSRDKVILAASVVMYLLDMIVGENMHKQCRVLFIVMLKHLAVGLRRLIVGFIDRKDGLGGSDAFFASLADPIYLFKFAIYVAQTHIGDGLLVSKHYLHYFRYPPYCRSTDYLSYMNKISVLSFQQ